LAVFRARDALSFVEDRHVHGAFIVARVVEEEVQGLRLVASLAELATHAAGFTWTFTSLTDTEV